MAPEPSTGLYDAIVKLIRETPAPVLMTIVGVAVFVFGAAHDVKFLRFEGGWKIAVVAMGGVLFVAGVSLVVLQTWFALHKEQLTASSPENTQVATVGKPVSFHTFCGLKEETRAEDVFQDFEMGNSNINPVQFLWADACHGSRVHAVVDGRQKSLRIEFDNQKNSRPSNVAIRAKGERALRIGNDKAFLEFEARIPKDAASTKQLLGKIVVSVRLVNGWLQHWAFGDQPNQSRQFLIDDTEWRTITVPLKSGSWTLFPADGNHLEGPKREDFSIISCIVFEFGSERFGQMPGPGKGIVEIGRIRLR